MVKSESTRRLDGSFVRCIYEGDMCVARQVVTALELHGLLFGYVAVRVDTYIVDMVKPLSVEKTTYRESLVEFENMVKDVRNGL